MLSRLQYISDGKTAEEQLENIRQVLDAGCQWVQFRFKSARKEEREQTADEVLRLCRLYDAICIINDEVQLTKKTNADGVHLGLKDMPTKDAKRILPDKIIGGTANTFADVAQHSDAGCTYVGLGPLRFTATKKELSPVLGLGGYERIMSEMQSSSITIPVIAIGGITVQDIPALRAMGIYGIAVSGLLNRASNKKELLNKLNELLK